MTSNDRISAWLDNELSHNEARLLASEMAADPELAAEADLLAEVRDLVRSQAQITAPDEVFERVCAAVGADQTAVAERPPLGGMRGRRRVPTFAAVAATLVIVAGVVGGVGGSTTLPAVGDLVARHSAAAAGDPMPPSDEGALHDAMTGGLAAMPGGYEITQAWQDDTLTHLVFAGPDDSMVSVFRQAGNTDVDMVGDEMAEGEVGDVGGVSMWSGSVGDAHVAVLDGDGYLWTAVGDTDHDTMMVMMSDLPARRRGVLERLRDAADAVVDPFRLGS